MIDRNARTEALKLLGKISNSRLTNWQLEDAWPESKSDPAINCILRWLWSLYDDDKEVVIADILIGQERILSRCKEFLASECEFSLKKLSEHEQRAQVKEWGVEWIPGCTGPDDSESWPFPSPDSK